MITPIWQFFIALLQRVSDLIWQSGWNSRKVRARMLVKVRVRGTLHSRKGM
jgi:hypothetical protein